MVKTNNYFVYSLDKPVYFFEVLYFFFGDTFLKNI